MGYIISCIAGLTSGFFIALVLFLILAIPRQQKRPLTKEEWKSGKRHKEIY